MKKSIYKFTLLTLLAFTPVFAYMGLYITLDPFRVIYKYEPYFSKSNPMHIGWNKGYVSTENFKQQYKKQNYNSFIFGTSRSINFLAADWKPYLPQDASIYHFDASAESLTGIYNKIKYTQSMGVDIKNALIVMEVDLLPRVTGLDGHLYIQHPEVTPESDTFEFYLKFFDVFCDHSFIKPYLDYQINGIKDYMTDNGIFTLHSPTYDPITNEERYPELDSLIYNSPNLFFTKDKLAKFPKANNETIADRVLTNDSEPLLIIRKIKKALNGADIKIIIPPNLTLTKINQQDKAVLKSIFGEINVFDFSGDSSIARDYHSYYDNASHARPEICKILIDSIYSNQ